MAGGNFKHRSVSDIVPGDDLVLVTNENSRIKTGVVLDLSFHIIFSFSR